MTATTYTFGPITLTAGEVERYIRVRLPNMKKSGGQYRGPCPIHGGERDSFAINSETGQWFCHSVCNRGGDTVGLHMEIKLVDFVTAKAEVFSIIGRVDSPYNAPPTRRATKALPVPLGPVVARYDYTNETGELLYQVTRHRDPKEFKQRRPDGRGGFIPNLEGVRPVPFNLVALMASEKVVICEGEKDCLNVEAKLGWTATTNSGGATHFRPELVPYFAGKHVVILPDNDDKGRKHGETVAGLVSPVAASVRVVNLPGLAEKGDVSDWLAAGGTEAELRALVRATPEWVPTTPEPEATPERPGIRCIEDIRAVSEYAGQTINYVVAGVIAEGTISMLTGESGSGKTTLAEDLAGKIASGVPFAGLETSKRRVLVMDRENPAAVVLERRARLGITEDNPNVWVWGGWCEDEPCEPASPIITTWVQACDPKPVIVIDSFVAFAQCDENSATEVRAFMQALRRLANMGATVILIHHSGKGESSKDFRGSSDIKAAVDVAYHVSNLGDPSRLTTLRLRAFKARFSVLPELLLHYTEGAGFRMDDRPVYVASNEVLRQMLTAHPGVSQRAFKQMAAETGVSDRIAREFLRVYIANRKIRTEQGPRNSDRLFWADSEGSPVQTSWGTN